MIKVDGLPYWRLSGFYFLFFLGLGAFMPYWSLYLKSLGMTAGMIGVLGAVVVVTRIFSSFLWGWVVDYSGRRGPVIRLASLFSLLSFSLALFYQDFGALLVILFVFSIFWSAALPQMEAVTLAHLGRASNRYTVIRIWGSIGFIAAVLALGVFFDQNPIYLLTPILILLLLLAWLQSLFIPDFNDRRAGAGGPRFRTTLLQPPVGALLAVCFLMQASHGGYYTFFSIYLAQYHYSAGFIGAAWALGVFAEVLVYLFMHRLIGRFGLRRLMLLALLAATLRWLLTAGLAEYVAVLVFAQCLHAASFGIYHAVAIQYVHQWFKGNQQGRGQALYSGVSFGAGLAAGGLLSGYLWQAAGAAPTFVFAALLSAAGLAIAWCRLPEPEKPR